MSPEGRGCVELLPVVGHLGGGEQMVEPPSMRSVFRFPCPECLRSIGKGLSPGEEADFLLKGVTDI